MGLDFFLDISIVNSIIQVLAGLTGLPVTAFEAAAATRRRMTTLSLEVRGAGAGAAGNLVESTLTTNPNYLTSQDASLGRVDGVSLSRSSPTAQPETLAIPVWAIVVICVLGALLIAGAIVVVLLVMRRKRDGQRSNFASPNIEMRPNPANQ